MVRTEQDRLGAQERHADLIAKLEGAAEGSRESDCWLYALSEDRNVREVVGPKGPWRGQRMLLGRHRKPPHDECVLGTWREGRFETVGKVPHFTTSIDAAVALFERLKPNSYFHVGTIQNRDGKRVYGADVSCGASESFASTPALALCIALLKALEDTPQGMGEEGGG